MSTTVEMTTSPVLAPILSAVKDVDANVRSELYALDRNVGNNILASGIETKEMVNRNSDFALNDNRRNHEFATNDQRTKEKCGPVALQAYEDKTSLHSQIDF